MESIRLIDKLEDIPVNSKYADIDIYEMTDVLHTKETTDCFIETAFAVEIGMIQLFNSRNIPDNLFEAYNSSFSNSEMSLYEHYKEILGRGEDSVLGFINNLKGKFFEYELPEKLKEIYPDHNFKIVTNPTQPVWDIEAINSDGITDFLVQAKMWQEENAKNLQGIMESNPDVLYAVSNEIRNKILDSSPELAERLPVFLDAI